MDPKQVSMKKCGIGVAPPEVDTTGICACGGGPKDWHANFI